MKIRIERIFIGNINIFLTSFFVTLAVSNFLFRCETSQWRIIANL